MQLHMILGEMFIYEKKSHESVGSCIKNKEKKQNSPSFLSRHTIFVKNR